MQVTRRTAAHGEPLTLENGADVTAEDIERVLHAGVGLSDEQQEIRTSNGHNVAFNVSGGAGGGWVVRLTVEAHDELAAFTAAMDALDHAHRQLVLAAHEAETPDWGGPLGSTWFRKKKALSGLVGNEKTVTTRRNLDHELRMRIAVEVRDALGGPTAARARLVALLRPEDEKASGIRVAYEGDELLLSEGAGFSTGYYFEAAARVLFEEYLPDAAAGSPPRMAKVTGVITRDPAPAALRRWPLRISALLLLGLLGASWLMPVDTVPLIAGFAWWLVALGVAALAGAADRPSLFSVGGVAAAFLSLVVVFGLAYGVIHDTDGDLVKLAPWNDDQLLLGEMMLVSLGLAVSAGTTDVALQGAARFVAMVELLVFFGTVAGVLGAISRRWLYGRRATITGDLPIHGGLGDDGAR